MYFEAAYIPQNTPIMVKTRFNIGISSGLSTLLCQAIFALQRLKTLFSYIAMFSAAAQLSMINWLLTFLYNMPHSLKNHIYGNGLKQQKSYYKTL